MWVKKLLITQISKTMLFIIMLLIIGFVCLNYGNKSLEKMKQISTYQISDASSEQQLKFSEDQSRRKKLEMLGFTMMSIAGLLILWAFALLVQGLPVSKQVYGWGSVILLLSGMGLIQFGGEKPRASDYYRFSVPSGKQIIGFCLLLVGGASLLGLSLGN